MRFWLLNPKWSLHSSIHVPNITPKLSVLKMFLMPEIVFSSAGCKISLMSEEKLATSFLKFKCLPHPSWTEIPPGLSASSNLTVQLQLLHLTKAFCNPFILKTFKTPTLFKFTCSKNTVQMNFELGLEISEIPWNQESEISHFIYMWLRNEPLRDLMVKKWSKQLTETIEEASSRKITNTMPYIYTK